MTTPKIPAGGPRNRDGLANQPVDGASWARSPVADTNPQSFVRYQEFNAEIEDLAENSHAAADVLNADGTITISAEGQAFTIGLNVATSGNIEAGQGLIGVGENGVYVVLGTGADVAAAGNHTHPEATEETDGFMAAADKAKLDGIAAGATNVQLAGSGEAATASHSDHTHSDATEETDGFMAAADKAKLDALPTSDEITANVVTAVAGALTNSTTVSALFEGGLISFSVIVATAFQAASGEIDSEGEGAIIMAEAGGLAVSLGPSGSQAAPGNHTHALATESQPGFMSAADKAKVDALSSTYWAEPVADPGDLPLNTDAVGTVRLVTSQNAIYACISQTGDLDEQWEIVSPILSSEEQAEAGTDNTTVMTPLRTMQLVVALALAPLNSPAFTGAPTAPTPNALDSSTRIATTAFVSQAVASALPDGWRFNDNGDGTISLQTWVNGQWQDSQTFTPPVAGSSAGAPAAQPAALPAGWQWNNNLDGTISLQTWVNGQWQDAQTFTPP